MKKEKIILKSCNLDVWYNGFQALNDVCLDIPANKVTALMGASGCGKSTFLRAINRMLDTIPNTRIKGSIAIDGKNIYEENTDIIELRRNTGMVFQNPTPFPKSIYDNVAYGLTITNEYPRKDKHIINYFKKIIKPEIDYKLLEKSKHPVDKIVIRSFKEAALWDEVKDRLHKSAFRLSGGQQQRLCIARTIATMPDILLLDEPTSELDPIATKKIEQLILKLKKKYTIIIVTHNMQQAQRISDYSAFFHLGEIIEFGQTKQVFNNPKHKLTKSYVTGEFS